MEKRAQIQEESKVKNGKKNGFKDPKEEESKEFKPMMMQPQDYVSQAVDASKKQEKIIKI